MQRDKITANYLIRNTAMGKLRRETDDIYKSIESKLLEASYNGHSDLDYDLPDTFETNTLELKDLQLVVYSDIIDRLDHSGFSVELTMRPNGCLLHISWPAGLSKPERRRRTDLIKSHIKKSN